jgi:hypothetical protein
VSADVTLVSQAIVVWTGWARPHDRHATMRGSLSGSAPTGRWTWYNVRRLKEEFYESDAKYVAADLAEMGDMVSRRFGELHPEISDDAVRALAWCYRYDYK